MYPKPAGMVELGSKWIYPNGARAHTCKFRIPESWNPGIEFQQGVLNSCSNPSIPESGNVTVLLLSM